MNLVIITANIIHENLNPPLEWFKIYKKNCVIFEPNFYGLRKCIRVVLARTKFQLSSSVRKGVMPGTRSKHKKIRTKKKQFSRLSGGEMGLKRQTPQKAHP